jgi:DNA-binding CsgD family transcriptional regulator
MSAYGLTEREQQLTQGYLSLDIADHLKISVHTVQSHLSNIFTKTGVQAQCDLVTGIFFAHYAPRLRDNEQCNGNESAIAWRAGWCPQPASPPRPGTG